MPAKTDQLQIRVTRAQKALLKRRASAAGVDVSTYVLARALPPDAGRFTGLLQRVARDANPTFALAGLSDFLHATTAGAFADAVGSANISGLTVYLANYIAAMVEHAAYMKSVAPPAWTRHVTPLAFPHFVTPLVSLRPHLLRSSPVPFKRRNIFVDSSVGDRA